VLCRVAWEDDAGVATEEGVHRCFLWGTPSQSQSWEDVGFWVIDSLQRLAWCFSSADLPDVCLGVGCRLASTVEISSVTELPLVSLVPPLLVSRKGVITELQLLPPSFLVEAALAIVADEILQ
jgi:hypothetical protein